MRAPHLLLSALIVLLVPASAYAIDSTAPELKAQIAEIKQALQQLDVSYQHRFGVIQSQINSAVQERFNVQRERRGTLTLFDKQRLHEKVVLDTFSIVGRPNRATFKKLQRELANAGKIYAEPKITDGAVLDREENLLAYKLAALSKKQNVLMHEFYERRMTLSQELVALKSNFVTLIAVARHGQSSAATLARWQARDRSNKLKKNAELAQALHRAQTDHYLLQKHEVVERYFRRLDRIESTLQLDMHQKLLIESLRTEGPITLYKRAMLRQLERKVRG